MNVSEADNNQLGWLHGGDWDKPLLASLHGVSCVCDDPKILIWGMKALGIDCNAE